MNFNRRRRRNGMKSVGERPKGSRRLLGTWWRARLCKLNPEMNRWQSHRHRHCDCNCNCHRCQSCHRHHHRRQSCHDQMAGRCYGVRLDCCGKIGRSLPSAPPRERPQRGGIGEIFKNRSALIVLPILMVVKMTILAILMMVKMTILMVVKMTILAILAILIRILRCWGQSYPQTPSLTSTRSTSWSGNTRCRQ